MHDRNGALHGDFLLQVRARVYRRLAESPLTDPENPNYGFDYGLAYENLVRDNFSGFENSSLPKLATASSAQIAYKETDEASGRGGNHRKSGETIATPAIDVEACVLNLTMSPNVSQTPERHPFSGRRGDCGLNRESTDRQAKRMAPAPGNMRRARTRTKPSQQLLARLMRALVHPVYLVERRKDGRSFCVMGSSGSIYSVVIGQTPRCNCPDFIKRSSGQSNSSPGPCKHVLFVMHRVLKVDKYDNVLYQVRLTPDELERVFREAPPVPTAEIMADDYVVQKFQESEELEASGNGASGDCPICMEGFCDEEKEISLCTSCRNGVHSTCMEMYLRAGVGEPKCPLCRREWTPLGQEEPLNLARYSSKHAQSLTYAQLYPETHQYIGRPPRGKRRQMG